MCSLGVRHYKKVISNFCRTFLHQTPFLTALSAPVIQFKHCVLLVLHFNIAMLEVIKFNNFVQENCNYCVNFWRNKQMQMSLGYCGFMTELSRKLNVGGMCTVT